MGESGVPPLTRPEDILRQVEQMPLIAMPFFSLSSIREYAIDRFGSVDCCGRGAGMFYCFRTLCFDARLWSVDD